MGLEIDVRRATVYNSLPVPLDLTGDRAKGNDSKHYSISMTFSPQLCMAWLFEEYTSAVKYRV